MNDGSYLLLEGLRERDESMVVTLRNQWGESFAVLDSVLEEFLQAFRMLEQQGYSVHEGSVRDAQLRLVARSFNSIQAALLVMKRGYFQQALTLVRMVSEDQLVAEDVAVHPPTLEALLHDTAKLGVGDLSYSAMAGRISEKAQGAWKEDYGNLSRQGAHPRMGSMLGVLTPSGGGTTIGLGGRYEEFHAAWVFFELFSQIKHMFVRLAELTGEAGATWVEGAMSTWESAEREWTRLDEWARGKLDGLEE